MKSAPEGTSTSQLPSRDVDRDTSESSPDLPLARLAFLIAAILLGAAVGLLALAKTFPHVPTDVRRLGVLLEALESKRPSPEIVVFGNSALMSGVDTSALTEAIRREPVAWNLASTGQSLVEAFLLTQELPKSVELGIYGLYATPGPDPGSLHANKYNTLFMYGFRPSAKTRATIESLDIPKISALLERSALSQTFSSRWALRQLIDTQSRVLLRPDLALAKATFDLFHPQTYENRIDPAIAGRLVQERSRAFNEAPPAISKESTRLAEQIARNATQLDRKTVFLFPPVHPDLFAVHGHAILGAAKKFEQSLGHIPNTRVIYAVELLSREHFIDDVHPTNQGAEILTAFLASQLAMSR